MLAEQLTNFAKTILDTFLVNTIETKTVILEGNIGAGKTTLANWMRNNTQYLVIPEPIERWHNLHGFNLLEAYYEDQEKWAMTFQVYAILTMLKRHWYSTAAYIKVMERSLISAAKCFIPLLFETNVINQQQKEILEEWIYFLMQIFDLKVNAIIYIRIAPEVAYARINQRGRLGEDRISLDYLKRLHLLYDSWLVCHNGIDTYEISGIEEPDEVERKALSIINQLCN